VLAAVGTLEGDNGQSGAPGVHSGTNAYGAAGPMQFGTGGAAGNTWGGAPVHLASEHTGGYGIDGDGDGIADVYDPGDAIPSAAWFLQAHGALTNLPAALFDWNHSAGYLSNVLSWAARYAAGGAEAVLAATSAQCQLAAAGPLPAGTAGKVIAYAEAQLGKPYQWGATGPDAYDCSGLAMMACRAAGVYIPRTSQQQWQSGTRIPAPAVQPGDLVFFAGADGTPQAPGHVGIVIGNDKMIEAYATGYPIRIATYGQPTSPSGDQVVVGVTRPDTGFADRIETSGGGA
jgi:peptidoglycan DL-endopeptidase CwlO